MYKATKSYSHVISVIVLLALLLSACGKAASFSSSIGVLADIGKESTSAGAVGVALEQQSGYETGLKAAKISFTPKNINESIPQSDIQRTIRSQAEDLNAPLIALLGATSNNASSHAAALVNFFNIPMLVPSANGDNLFPTNNLWAFRLSAPGAAYANYLFGQLVTKQSMDAMVTKLGSPLGVAPELKIAILYEQNTFGESAAVATATAAIAQSIKIGVYSSFKPENPDPTSLKLLADKVNDAGVQLVYLVSSDPALAKKLVQILRSTFDAQSMPLVVGQAGGFAALDYLGSTDAEGVYVLRQQIDRKDCPANIQASYDAQSYAAVYLLDRAVQQAREKLASVNNGFSLSEETGTTVLQQREAIREELKQINLDVPCLGMVAFDNSGQNKLLKLEILVVKKGQALPSSAPEFFAALEKRLSFDLLQP